MFDLVGLTTISIIFLINLLIALRWPEIFTILIVAFIIRFLFLIINNHFFYLPDGDMDGLIFEQRGLEWSQEGFFHVFDHFIGPDAYFLSFLIAIPYSLIGRSFLMIQSFSILFGLGSVFLGWLIAKKLWNNSTAIKVGWVIALFPSLVLYSVLIMREVYICFFLLLAIYGVINWSRLKDYKSIFLAIFGFIGATFFHGASVVGLIIFILIILLDNLKRSLKLILSLKINLKSLMIIMVSLIILMSYTSNKIDFPYLNNFENATNPDKLKDIINRKVRGEASYPEWTKIDSNSELFYKIPIRAVYFILSPFPWEVKKLSHLVGLFDSLLHATLIFLIILNFKVIWRDPALKNILIILLFYFVVFGVGVGNFGTGIRHRSKFVIELILLAAPLIPKLTLFKKKINKVT